MFVSTGIFKHGSEWGCFVWQDRASWQWQPTLTSHDPNPPITLEDEPVVGGTFNAAWSGASSVAGVVSA